jgi:predicted RNA-binding Zn ribbon-like protein
VLFTHDTELSLQCAAALVNTGLQETEELATPEQLGEFVRRWDWTGRVVGDQAELAEVRALRPRLRQLWLADEDETVRLVNEMLREAKALPQLVKHDQYDYHLHATPSDAALADRMMVEAAMAVVDVVRAGELGRLRICAADDCRSLVVDLSKNRSRRFCDAGCGNRTNVAAYRARQAGKARRV